MYTNTGSMACVKVKSATLSTVESLNVTQKTTQPHTGVTSNSKKGTLAVEGALDWSAGCTSWQLVPGMIPGETALFEACQGIGTGESATPVKYSGNVILTQLQTTIDVKNRAPIKWQYTFQGAGKLTTTTAEMTDATTPEIVRPIAAAFTVTKADAGGTNGESSVVTTNWNLTEVSINIQAAASGGGATSSSEGWFKRLAGPMNFSFDMTFENDRVSDLNFDVGDNLAVVITLDNGETIEIKWIAITGFGEVTLDNNSAEPITIPANGTMNAYSQAAESYGAIVIADTQIWPAEESGT